MKLKLSEQAQQDIARIDAWWLANASKNPLCFREELHDALDHIESTPLLSSTYTSPTTGKTFRKVPLHKSREIVYYEYFPEQELVAVVTVFSPRTGGEPDI